MPQLNGSTTRRQFLAASTATLSSLALTSRLPAQQAIASQFPRGNAEHCIFVWLGGGMAQMQETMLTELVQSGEITQAQAEAFNEIHDRLLESGLMQ